jgi:glycosyl transferase, family 25
MEIFIINLKRSAGRRVRMIEMLKKLKLKYILFEAVDGFAIPEKELVKHVKPNHQYTRSFTPGEIGCFLSHYSIYEKIAKENIPYALVLEDDVQLSHDFPALLNKVEFNIKQGDVISFYITVPEPCRFYRGDDIDEQYFYIRPYPGELVLGAVAYVITNRAAQKFVHNILPLDNVIDDWRTWFKNNLIQDFKIVYPHPVDLSDQYSDIGESFGNLELQLKKFIVNHKIPFFSHLILKKRRARRLKDRNNRIFIND